MSTKTLMCVGCEQAPENISEICYYAREEGMTPEEFVLDQEGTLNTANGHFYCTGCLLRWEAKNQRRFLGVAP